MIGARRFICTHAARERGMRARMIGWLAAAKRAVRCYRENRVGKPTGRRRVDGVM